MASLLPRNQNEHQDGSLASDLNAAKRTLTELISPSLKPQTRMVLIVRETTRILRAESACVFESRGQANVMTELYRLNWRDWQTDSLLLELTGRTRSAITRACMHMEWAAPEKTRHAEWHCMMSCLPAEKNYLLTLAFARRQQGFSEHESNLLRGLHESGVLQWISPRVSSEREGELNPQLHEVLFSLLQGHSDEQIARELGLSLEKVRGCVAKLYRHYGVASRGELMTLSIEPASRMLQGRVV